MRPGLIRSVRANGTTSGLHAGRLRAYSRGRGASFVPLKPFVQGERVGGGGPHPRPGARRASRSRSPTWARSSRSSTCRQPQPASSSSSSRGPTSPRREISVLKRSSGLSGDVFLTPLPSPIVHPGSTNMVTISPVGPGGPMIIDARRQARLVRAARAARVATNLRLQRYGRRTRADLVAGPGHAGGVRPRRGRDRRHARTARSATVHAGNGYAMDLHEFELTPERDALFTVYSPILVHLPGTPAGTLSPLLDAIVQEVDIAHRAGGLGVARLRPHPARGLARHARQQRLLRRLPHQLDPGAVEGPRARSRLATPRRSTRSSAPSGRDRLDAGRQGEQLPARARARTSTSSTTRRCCRTATSACSTTRPARRRRRPPRAV